MTNAKNLAQSISLSKLYTQHNDIVFYVHVASVFRSQCAELIHRAGFGDFVVKPAFPVWAKIETRAIAEAATKQVAIIEEQDLFDAKELAFGREKTLVQRLTGFVNMHPDHTLHIIVPTMWRTLPTQAIDQLIRDLSTYGVHATIAKAL